MLMKRGAAKKTRLKTARPPKLWPGVTRILTPDSRARRRVREMGKERSQRIADTAPKALRARLRDEVMQREL